MIRLPRRLRPNTLLGARQLNKVERFIFTENPVADGFTQHGGHFGPEFENLFAGGRMIEHAFPTQKILDSEDAYSRRFARAPATFEGAALGGRRQKPGLRRMRAF